MLISIIAIFYNSEVFISRCLDSILRQEEVEVEIIAVDDCSSDSTFQLLKKYEENFNKIKVIRHDVNKGISEARNSGLRNISGDCFFLIDGDDCLSDSRSLKNLADKFEKETDFVQGSYNIIKGEKIQRQILFPDETCSGFNQICNNFDKFNFMYTHNKLWNIKWAKIFFIPGIYHEDRIWNASIFKDLTKISSISYPTYNYYINNSNTSNLSRSKRKYIDSGIKYVECLKELPSCWNNIKETFIIVDIVKPLYLFEKDKRYRKEVRRYLDNYYPLSIDVSGFPRFTKLLHKFVNKRIPDFMVNTIAKSYIRLMNTLNKPV